MLRRLPLAVLLLFALVLPAHAHFGMVIPDKNLVEKDGNKTVTLDLRFWHPMENQGMNLVKPKFELLAQGKKTDLSAGLKQVHAEGKEAWQAFFEVKRPGVYAFAMTPQPYWEPSEDKYIVHITKTVISALGDEEGWDRPMGLKLEIVPLVKPFALYAGNVFTGKVLFKGKPLANSDVEVEFRNADGALKAPAEAYVSQVVKTDANGIFSYAAPWAGWWGFAALTDDDAKMKKDGKDKKVELGGVFWAYFHALPGK